MAQNEKAVGASENPPKAIILNFDEFMGQQFDNGEEIACDLRRCELGLIASVTNVGKSTLLRNALLALATGSEFSPLVPPGPPRRVLLLDFESSASRLQDDLAVMTDGWSSEKLALLRENFFVSSEGMIDDDLLSLSTHLELVAQLAAERKVDLMAVDTAGAGFDLSDENNNGEAARYVLKPLLRLARLLNCAVIMIHHIGKANSEEGRTRDTVHKPRGASSFSGYAASVFVLESDTQDDDSVTLSCAKRKSGPNYKHSLKLDRDTRWFTSTGALQRQPTPYELVRRAVLDTGGEVKRATIDAILRGQVAARTITRCLAKAVEVGELRSPKKGFYAANSGNGQSATDIGVDQLAVAKAVLSEYEAQGYTQ